MAEPRFDTSSRTSSLPPPSSQLAKRSSNEAPLLPRIEGISSNGLFPLSDHSHPSGSQIAGEQQKLIPRSAIAHSSTLPLLPVSTSSNIAQDVLVESDSEDRRANTAGVHPFRTSALIGQSTSQNHLSMLDFLTAEPRLIKSGSSSGSAASAALRSAEGSRSSMAARTRDNEISDVGRRRVEHLPAASSPKRKSMSMLGKAPIRGASRDAATSRSMTAHSDSENEREMINHLPNREERSAGLTIPLGRNSPFQDRTGDSTSAYRTGKGKERRTEEEDAVPLLQLKVIPVTDLIIMFGSTQTSSNYSLSGKVVLRLRRDAKKTGHPLRSHRNDPGLFPNGSYESGPEDQTWQSYPMSASDSSNSFKTALGSEDERDSSSAEENVINVRSLQIVFSGFALYGDRTGRLATTRLAHSQYDLLPPGGTNIAGSSGSKAGQDYEIEFNLSVPGWLPSSLTSRFGGTFYCLEAKAEYHATSRSEATPQKHWLVPPPRSGSRTESPSPLSSSFEDCRSYDSDAVDERPSSQDKERDQRESIVTSRTLPVQARASWLSKTARQLQIKVVKSTSSPAQSLPGSALVTPTQASTEGRFSGYSSPSMLAPSNGGLVQVKSKAKTIVIGRCREVVPVPLARMAVIGPEGLPEGAFQDPPPLPRSSSVDRHSRSRSSTITPATLHRHPSPPPPVPSALTAPSDPAKLATLATSSSFSQPRTPRRGSSTLTSHDAPGHSSHHSSSHRSSRRSDNNRRPTSAVPMRHFMHRPMLHPPASAHISGAEGGLPFSLTLTLPSYVTVDGPESDILSFSLQIEVGRSTAWSKVRELGGLRLRDMQLQCIQTERHSSVASRTFCSSYPLPLESKVEPHEIPVIETWRGHDTRRFPFQQEASKLRAAYDRSLVDEHLELLRVGRAPPAAEQNVERVRTSVVGPPPGHRSRKGSTEGDNPVTAPRYTGKSNADRERREGSMEPDKNSQRTAPGTARKDRRKSMPASASAPSGLALSAARRALAVTPPHPADSSSSEREDAEVGSTSTPGDTARRTGRGRRAYQSAIRGLSNLATAVLDISLDMEGNTGQNAATNGDETGRRGKGSDKEASQPAFHYFSGSDGHGVDLTKGRVRMAINLPLVSSDGAKAKATGASRLVADFESPYIRVRHKLKVKLGFGFGSKPLGGEEDGSWGQALVMCVPVRFTDAAPREVREQFAPLPVTQFATAATGDQLSSAIPVPPSTREHEAPLLPSYNQLFREDGSRLADEGEDLPQYPGPATMKTRSLAPIPPSGSVTAPVPRVATLLDERGESDTDAGNGPGEAATLFDNRIVPSRVVDESLPVGQASDIASRQQQVEFEEMELEEAQEARQTADRLNETVNLDDEDDLYEDFGDEDALGVFSSSDQARSGAEEDSQVEND